MDGFYWTWTPHILTKFLVASQLPCSFCHTSFPPSPLCLHSIQGFVQSTKHKLEQKRLTFWQIAFNWTLEQKSWKHNCFKALNESNFSDSLLIKIEISFIYFFPFPICLFLIACTSTRSSSILFVQTELFLHLVYYCFGISSKKIMCRKQSGRKIRHNVKVSQTEWWSVLSRKVWMVWSVKGFSADWKWVFLKNRCF